MINLKNLSAINMGTKKDNSKIKIDLTPAKKETVSNTVFKWGINTGKIIIIFTQLITMGTLFYRFILDRQIIDLKDQITSKEALVKSQSKREKEYRDLQKRIISIKQISDETQLKSKVTNDIISEIKNLNLITKRFVLTKNIVTVEADVPSVFEMNQFINNVKKIEEVQSINASDITGNDAYTNFIIEINLPKTQSDNLQEQNSNASQD